MTINQAITAGIKAVRQEPWNEYCHLELPILQDGGHGPWAHLIDPCSNLSLGNPAENPIPVLLVKGILSQPNADPDSDEWEEWERPDDYERLLGGTGK